ncbi:MAG: type IV pili methyl-accepting chemotaxis transducer N-terminal domain-containing protein [Paracoccaceae bacterium]
MFADVVRDEKRVWTRILLAGEQRYMQQRIEKSACFAMTGVETLWFRDDAMRAADTFNANLDVLQSGNGDLDLPAEDSPEVLERLEKTVQFWAKFEPAARQVMNGDTHTIPVRQLMDWDALFLAELQQTAEVIQAVHKQNLLARQSLASTIDVASRQQMLATRMAKSYCYIALDLRRAEMKSQLVADIEEYKRAMKAMEFGDFDLEVIDPPGLKALMAVSQMNENWETLHEMFDTILQLPNLGTDQLMDVSNISVELSRLAGTMIDIYLN